jgi:hypothetical protein
MVLVTGIGLSIQSTMDALTRRGAATSRDPLTLEAAP